MHRRNEIFCTFLPYFWQQSESVKMCNFRKYPKNEDYISLTNTAHFLQKLILTYCLIIFLVIQIYYLHYFGEKIPIFNIFCEINLLESSPPKLYGINQNYLGERTHYYPYKTGLLKQFLTASKFLLDNSSEGVAAFVKGYNLS